MKKHIAPIALFFSASFFLFILGAAEGFAQRGPAPNNIKWTKLRSSNPQDSTQSRTGQEHYVLQLALSDTVGIKAFRLNASNASSLSSISNVSYELKDQRIYRSPKNGDYVVYIDLGKRSAGSIKNGDVQLLNNNGLPILGTSAKSFTAP